MRNLFRAFTPLRFVVLACVMLFASASCALAAVDADSLALAGAVNVERQEAPNPSTDVGAPLAITPEAALDSVLHFIEHGRPSASVDAALHQQNATRPSDEALLNAAQVDLKSLAWRVSDGKYRATSRTGTVGTWEPSIRDALWRALFATATGARTQ